MYLTKYVYVYYFDIKKGGGGEHEKLQIISEEKERSIRKKHQWVDG